MKFTFQKTCQQYGTLEGALGNWQQEDPLEVIASVEVSDDVGLKRTDGRDKQKEIKKQSEVKRYEWGISKQEEERAQKIRVCVQEHTDGFKYSPLGERGKNER